MCMIWRTHISQKTAFCTREMSSHCMPHQALTGRDSLPVPGLAEKRPSVTIGLQSFFLELSSDR